jgi:hypothetical protein
MFRVWAGWLAFLWMLCAPVVAREVSPLVLSKGARVGVLSVLYPEVTHYHSGKSLRDGALKTETVDWSVSGMFMDALKDRATQMGWVLVPLQVTNELDDAREACFLNGNFSKSLPKSCVPPFEHLVESDRVQAIFVLAPGLNTATHAGSARRKELPETMRGWGFGTGEAAAPDGKPSLFNMTEMLVVAPSPEGPQLRAREWGGNYTLEWTSFSPPPDIKAIPLQQYSQLQPFFEAILSRQSARLLEQVDTGP